MNTRVCAECGSSFCVDSIYSNRKFCSHACRFKSIVPKEFNKEKCENWPKSINSVTGYGQFNASFGPPVRLVSAHRMSYEVFNGPLCDGDVVRHSCDNRACINPHHLVKGTQADNVNDMWSRNRQQDYSKMPKGDDNPSRRNKQKLCRGERHWSSRLTAENVVEIRKSQSSHAELGRHYGVSAAAIAAVRKRKTWRHVK